MFKFSRKVRNEISVKGTRPEQTLSYRNRVKGEMGQKYKLQAMKAFKLVP